VPVYLVRASGSLVGGLLKVETESKAEMPSMSVRKRGPLPLISQVPDTEHTHKRSGAGSPLVTAAVRDLAYDLIGLPPIRTGVLIDLIVLWRVEACLPSWPAPDHL
jgi:hypothetical protein